MASAITLALLSHFASIQPVQAGLVGSNSQNVGLEAGAVFLPGVTAFGSGDITIVGGDALLADSGPVGTMADINDLPSGDQISIYVVRPGDTLGDIAQMFNVSVNTIIWANDLSRGKTIKVGDTLLILPVTGISHTVVKDETLQSLAAKYKGDVDEIVRFNGLEADTTLTVGDTVIIPDGEETAVAPLPGQKPPTRVRGAGAPEYRGYYLRPLVGGVKTQGLHGYNGVDLAAPTGTPIMASAAGTVIVSRSGAWNGGYGNYIVISHPNGTQTLYAHNSKNLVAVGETVSQGEVIGLIGSTGRSTGPHVHFEIRGAKNPF